MKKLILLVLFFSASIFAQDKKFQIDLGMNNGWYHFDDDIHRPQDNDINPRFVAAFHHYFVELGNFNASFGIKYNSLESNVEELFWDLPLESKIKNYYLSFPFQISYDTRFLNSNLIFNLQPSYLLQSKIIVWNSYTDGEIEEEIAGSMHRIQLFLGFGVEFSFDVFGQTLGVKSVYNYNPFSVFQVDLADYKITEAALFLTYSF